MKHLLFLLFSFSLTVSFAQSLEQQRESVLLHVNSADLIVGEEVSFSAFVTNSNSGQLSGLSKYLYVELVNAKGNAVIKSKLALEAGRGHGQMFLPSTLSTDRYRLTAYTRWMKNFQSYSQVNLTVINPYEKWKPGSGDAIPGLSIYPEGGALRPGQLNQIVIKANDLFKSNKVRLIDEENNEIETVVLDDLNMAKAVFMPKNDMKYQFVGETADGFKFFPLPEACQKCASIEISKKAGYHEVMINGYGIDENGSLLIENDDDVVSVGEVGIGSKLKVDNENIATGVNRVIWKSATQSVERLFYLASGRLTASSSIESLKSNSIVDYTLNVPPNSNFSVSISSHSPYVDQGHFIGSTSLSKYLDLGELRLGELNDAQIDNLLISTVNAVQFQEKTDVIKYLPESNLDIIEGIVQGEEVKDLHVALSFPGENAQVKIAKTNERGLFRHGIIPPEFDTFGYVDVLFEDSDYEIELYDEFYTTYPDDGNKTILIDSSRLRAVTKRSIANQIENGYHNVHQLADSISTPWIEQFENYRKYCLADFTQFPTLRDVFIEYIPEVGLSKNLNNYDFQIRDKQTGVVSSANLPTLILLDGLPVTGEEVLALSPLDISCIFVINQKFFFGNALMAGVVYFESYDDAYSSVITSYKQHSFVGVQTAGMRKIRRSNSRLPDYRSTILWEPMMSSIDGEVTISFNTSSLLGKFELRVEGIDASGNPFSQQAYFIVKD
ncbi:MAG: hypothetical protein JXQ90_09390 [Cyclobacteriaceae bacterium]